MDRSVRNSCLHCFRDGLRGARAGSARWAPHWFPPRRRRSAVRPGPPRVIARDRREPVYRRGVSNMFSRDNKRATDEKCRRGSASAQRRAHPEGTTRPSADSQVREEPGKGIEHAELARRRDDKVRAAANLAGCRAHRRRPAGPLEHLHVVRGVTDGRDLAGRDAVRRGQPRDSIALVRPGARISIPVMSLQTIEARPAKCASARRRTAPWRSGPVGRKTRTGRSPNGPSSPSRSRPSTYRNLRPSASGVANSSSAVGQALGRWPSRRPTIGSSPSSSANRIASR